MWRQLESAIEVAPLLLVALNKLFKQEKMAPGFSSLIPDNADDVREFKKKVAECMAVQAATKPLAEGQAREDVVSAIKAVMSTGGFMALVDPKFVFLMEGKMTAKGVDAAPTAS